MNNSQWHYLEQRHNSWRKQLYIKGKKLLASDVWSDMIVNKMTPDEIAFSKDLPLAAVTEALEYCESHRELLEIEAKEERRYLEAKGYQVEPQITHR